MRKFRELLVSHPKVHQKVEFHPANPWLSSFVESFEAGSEDKISHVQLRSFPTTALLKIPTMHCERFASELDCLQMLTMLLR